MSEQIRISYSIKDDSIINKPSLVENYQYRVPDSFEGIDTIGAKNDPMISVSFKNYYMKEIGANKVTSIKVQQLGLNNLWTNKNACSLVQQ